MSYLALKDYYEACLETHGPTHKGVDWPDEAGMRTRFDVMASSFQWTDAPIDILDVGCGPGFFRDYLVGHYPAPNFRYRGVDISPAMVAAAQQRCPEGQFEARDLIHDPLPADSVDYAIFNGVFTVRAGMSTQQAADFAASLLASVFPACRRGLAVNFMAPHADWQDEKLFYLPFDDAAQMFKTHLSRHFTFRSDYGLWEYTAFVMREPAASAI